MDLQSDGAVIIGGNVGVRRLAADGSVDAAFHSFGLAVQTLKVQTDGKVIFGGDSWTFAGLARVNKDGSPDPTFQDSVAGFCDASIYALALQSGGEVIAGGYFADDSCVGWNVLRLKANGSLDGTFLWFDNGMAIFSVAVQSDDKVLIGGDGLLGGGIGRLNADGSLDADFSGGFAGVSGTVRSLILQSDGKVLVGGDFTAVNGAPRSNLARLHAQIAFAPRIAGQPRPQTVGFGAGCVVAVSASGTAPLYYQWWKDGVSLPRYSGVNSNTLSIPSAQTNDSGVYSVVITNGYGRTTSSNAATSEVATLTVYLAPPVILDSPASTAAHVGQQVQLSATLGGSPPFQYQWLCNGIALAGETHAELVLPNVQTNQAGAYTLAVWNSAGAVTSSPPAVVTVGTVWIEWVSLSTHWVARLQLHGDTGKGYEVQRSTTLPVWSSVGAVTLAPGTNWFTNVAPAANAVLYRMRLLTNAAPLITTQPVSQTAEIGSTAVISVAASGFPFPVYQWQFSATNLPSQTNAVLALSNVQTNQAGSYRVIVTNSFGAVTSQVATLTVIPPRPRILPGSLVRANGQFRFTVQSPAGSRLEIQVSTNLVNWTSLTMVTNGTGTLPFVDTATNLKQRFYRARQVP